MGSTQVVCAFSCSLTKRAWLLFVCLFAMSCTLLVNTVMAEAPAAVSAPQQSVLPLRETKLGNVNNVHVFEKIYLAGQPTIEDLPLLKQQGIKTIITVRHPDELRWDEEAAVKRLGMKFVQEPFQSPKGLTPKVFDNVRKVLRDKKQGPMMFHCGSANRVGAVWYAHRVLDGKLSPELALKEAQIVGLRTPAYLQKAQEYVNKKQQEKAAKQTQ